MTSKAISQTSQSKDSVTCLPNSELRAAIKEIEKGKIYLEENGLLKQNNQILLDRIKTKDSVIVEFQIKDSLNNKRYENCLIQSKASETQFKNQKDINAIYRNIEKKQRKIYAGGGFILGAIVTTLIVIFK